ncbi:hypothetical protein GCM10010462_03920 [Microbacterium dextranolyticum]|uniref:Sec-independent protein translocase protein TatA n=1 Tax=Microbacterium dextranolyticum TaxID=36806 RepID=A0A9W6HM34_9MICO|nr:hypothetical protein GCM10017591_18580 [Microbacterium dextranolyticum]
MILLLFGAAKLPALAKSMGQSARIFKGEMKAMKDDDAPAASTAADAPATPAAPTVQNTAAPQTPVAGAPADATPRTPDSAS